MASRNVKVTVTIDGEMKFERWNDGAGQGGVCPSADDAGEVISALKEALENARAMQRTGRSLVFEHHKAE